MSQFFIANAFSVIVIRFVESNIILCINNEITGIDVVALKYHLEDLWLMNSALLHKVNNLILNNNSVVDIVI